MRTLKRVISCLWFYFWGHVFSLLYKKKYITGRWFKGGRFYGLTANGWRWVTTDAITKIFNSANYTADYPISSGCRVICPENIEFDPDDLNNFQGFGNYFQAFGKIVIGKGTFIAPNVGLITANHDLLDPDEHLAPSPIILGKKCWIGMNSVILPGVTLGDHTVVGAGSIVTKSFEKGYCVIAGNPARIIKQLDSEEKSEMVG